MGKPYSDDLRERVVAAIEAGHTREEVAELYNMALSTVGGFIKRKRETGRVSPDKFGGYKTFALEPHTTLVTFRRKIDVFGSVVNGVLQSKDRRAAGGVFAGLWL